MEYMANILTTSMVCCPYVMVGLGQAIIVGAHSAGRTVHATAEDAVREIPLATGVPYLHRVEASTTCSKPWNPYEFTWAYFLIHVFFDTE